MEQLKVGDLIEIERIKHVHWAVYIGDNNVIHVHENSEEMSMNKDKLINVTNGNSWKINNYKDKKTVPRTPEEIVNIANYEYTNPNVYFRNCKRFAKYCRYHKSLKSKLSSVCRIILATLLLIVLSVIMSLKGVGGFEGNVVLFVVVIGILLIVAIGTIAVIFLISYTCNKFKPKPKPKLNTNTSTNTNRRPIIWRKRMGLLKSFCKTLGEIAR